MSVAVVTAVVVGLAAVSVALRLHARRRAANLRISGGRKSLVMNLFGRS